LQSRKEFNLLLGLAEVRIDGGTGEAFFETVAANLRNCSDYKFALACSIDGTEDNSPDRDYTLTVVLDLEDPPIRQLSYSLTKTLFRIPEAIPSLEPKAQGTFLDLLQKIHSAFTNATETQGHPKPNQS
jgi:hypothetical protein